MIIYIYILYFCLLKKFMIIVNYWLDIDSDDYVNDYSLDLVSVVNDTFSLNNDVSLVFECISNDEDFIPKPEILYEIHLLRGSIASDPINEPCFVISSVYEKVLDENNNFSTPLIKI